MPRRALACITCYHFDHVNPSWNHTKRPLISYPRILNLEQLIAFISCGRPISRVSYTPIMHKMSRLKLFFPFPATPSRDFLLYFHHIRESFFSCNPAWHPHGMPINARLVLPAQRLARNLNHMKSDSSPIKYSFLTDVSSPSLASHPSSAS